MSSTNDVFYPDDAKLVILYLYYTLLNDYFLSLRLFTKFKQNLIRFYDKTFQIIQLKVTRGIKN